MAEERLQRKKQKPNPVPKPQIKLDPSLPESELYAKLLEFERTVDATVLRKRYEIDETVRKPRMTEETLRVWVYSTTAASPKGGAPAKMLRIVGKAVAKPNSPPLPPTQKFTAFLKSVIVHFPAAKGGEDIVVEWHKAGANEATDGIEIEQPAGAGAEARISLSLEYSPPRFQVSESLRKALEMDPKIETRAKVLEHVWLYIKAHQLQAESRTKIVNDEAFKGIFGCESMDVSSLLRRLDEHLSPPTPIEISAKIGDRDQCYDVQVEVHNQHMVDAGQFLAKANGELKSQIDALDAEIGDVVAKIADHRIKRQFYQCLHHAPIDFINDLVASQVRDQALKGGEDIRGAEEKRTANFRKGWVLEATQRYLGIKAASQPAPQNPGTATAPGS